MFSPESSFWSRQTLNNSAETSPSPTFRPSFTKDTLAKAKMELMGMSADLTLKFMGTAFESKSSIYKIFSWFYYAPWTFWLHCGKSE